MIASGDLYLHERANVLIRPGQHAIGSDGALDHVPGEIRQT
jgi:hypothetical protein